MASAVRIIEICKITPPSESAIESFLPLTFFDTFSLIYQPADCIYFYELITDSFFSSVLPKLKQSLSLTLAHFLPFAGNLVWPSHSDKPFIIYTPGDGISLSVAESTADFHSLSGDSAHDAPDPNPYVPELNTSDTQAATMAFQITFFPSKGFCIGVSCNHAVMDGKSIMMFLYAWAHTCKRTDTTKSNPRRLPLELTPLLNRAVIQDPDGLDLLFLDMIQQSGKDTNPRSLKVQRATSDSNYVRATFKLSNEDINKLRQKALVSSETGKGVKFSRFVLVYSYVAIAVARAKRIEQSKNFVFGYAADARDRSDTVIPSNYFGNCIIPNCMITEGGCLMKEDGLRFVANELTESIEKLDKGALVGNVKHMIQVLRGTDRTSMQGISVIGSPEFYVYGIDFGWGKPKKFEPTPIYNGMSFLMATARDENSIEVCLTLKKQEMDMFRSIFFSDFRSRL